jgi:2-polyprenyl-3-methyl-5-hydroxy-6-metoxy-1,4-benzoquinol methylase
VKRMNWPVFEGPHRVDGLAETSLSSDIQYKYISPNPLIRHVSRRHVKGLVQMIAVSSRNSPLRIADIGCGDSFVSAAVLLNCRNVTNAVGVDISEDALALSREVFRQNGLHASLIRSSVYDLPFDDNAFDLVLCSEVLEHLEDVTAALRELHRVTRTYCLLSVPNDRVFRLANLARGSHVGSLGNSPGHIQHFNKQTLRIAVERHFDICVVRTLACLWITVLASKRHLGTGACGRPHPDQEHLGTRRIV